MCCCCAVLGILLRRYLYTLFQLRDEGQANVSLIFFLFRTFIRSQRTLSGEFWLVLLLCRSFYPFLTLAYVYKFVCYFTSTLLLLLLFCVYLIAANVVKTNEVFFRCCCLNVVAVIIIVAVRFVVASTSSLASLFPHGKFCCVFYQSKTKWAQQTQTQTQTERSKLLGFLWNLLLIQSKFVYTYSKFVFGWHAREPNSFIYSFLFSK